MRFACLFVAALVLGAGIAQAKEIDKPIPIGLSWHVSMDAQGHVTALDAIANKVVDEKAPQIRAALEQKIRDWNFVPGEVNGNPAATQSILTLHATIAASPGDDLQIRIESAHTGGGIKSAKLPAYPRSAIRDHKMGMVVLRVHYDANGKAMTADVMPDAPKVDKVLVDAAIASAMQWTFTPETVDGHGVASWIYSPVCFQVFDVRPSKMPACDWTPPGKKTPISQGEALALEPAVKLATDVADHAL